MRQPLLLAVVGLLFLFSVVAQSAPLTTITFDELLAGYSPLPLNPGDPDPPPIVGEALGNQYASLGVLFSMSAGDLTYGTSTAYMGSFPGAPSGDYVGVNTYPVFASPNGILTATFVMPGDPGTPGWVNGASLSLYLVDTNVDPSDRVIVQTYDLGGNLIEQLALTSSFGTLSFTNGLVHSLMIIDNGGDGHGLDDFAFGPVNGVPEPSTFALFGAGLIGLSLAVRRLRRS